MGIESNISENATKPAEVQGDQGRVKQHPLRDQIAADQYLTNKEALKNGHGIRITKIKYPGA